MIKRLLMLCVVAMAVFGAWAESKQWTVTKDQVPGKFWKLTSPDKKWVHAGPNW